jgi:hypothetical protein
MGLSVLEQWTQSQPAPGSKTNAEGRSEPSDAERTKIDLANAAATWRRSQSRRCNVDPATIGQADFESRLRRATSRGAAMRGEVREATTNVSLEGDYMRLDPTEPSDRSA